MLALTPSGKVHAGVSVATLDAAICASGEKRVPSYSRLYIGQSRAPSGRVPCASGAAKAGPRTVSLAPRFCGTAAGSRKTSFEHAGAIATSASATIIRVRVDAAAALRAVACIAVPTRSASASLFRRGDHELAIWRPAAIATLDYPRLRDLRQQLLHGATGLGAARNGRCERAPRPLDDVARLVAHYRRRATEIAEQRRAGARARLEGAAGGAR